MTERLVFWMPWAGHNARLLAERAKPRRCFGWSSRDPAKYVRALPRPPLFYTPSAAKRAVSEAVAGVTPGDGVSSLNCARPASGPESPAGRSFGRARP
jgi:hypothetical protein